MRVLWLCNIMLPAFAGKLGLPSSHREGWLTGLFERLTGRRSDVELGVCCPVPENLDGIRRSLPTWEGEVIFYGFYEDLNTPELYDERLPGSLYRILEDFKPDIVHIFGTEFPHALAMTRVFGDPSRILVGIQGLCCSIADTYRADLPYDVWNRSTFRDRYRHDSLQDQQRKFEQRAVNEREAILGCGHITGRTRFDRSVTARINPKAHYHVMNETMRSSFYRGQWRAVDAEPHTIFLSQGDYPLKGFHYMLQAMPYILESFPDARLYVAGNSIIGNEGGLIAPKKYPTPVWITSYGLYLKKLIRQNRLQGHVFMTGPLDAEAMKRRFLQSSVFVCPSIMENSPNSVCEAELLGMPVVAAKVGGIADLILDGEEGILFPGGRYKELAEGVRTVFYDQEIAMWLGENARHSARIRHNPDTNFRRLMEIYRSIV